MTDHEATLTAPCHFDKGVVDEIVEENLAHDDLPVTELYGAVSNEIVRHGRSREAVKNVTREEAVEFSNYLKEKGLGFIYLLNAPFDFNGTKDSRIKVEEYLDWIVNQVGPEAVTVSSHELARFIRDRYDSLNIYISTIAAISDIEKYDEFMDVKPTGVVLQYDQNRNWKNLELLAKHAEQAGAEIELMLNESCLRNCVNRQAHYAALGATETGKDSKFLTTCNTRKILYPNELLKSNYIRPEDVHIYEEMGIKRFKITGRSKPAEWLPEVVKAYKDRGYDGNLIRLLGIDPSLNAEDWTHINNKALDGYLAELPYNDEDEQSERWIQKLHSNGDFYLSDGTEYKLDETGKLKVAKLGARAIAVVRDEAK